MAYGSTSYVEVLKSLHLVPFCHTTMHTPDFLRALYLFTPNKQMHNYTPTRQTNTTAFHLYLPCLPFSVAIKLEPSTSQSFSMHINMHYTSTTQLPSTPPSVHNKHKGKNWRNGVKVLWCHIIPIFFG